MADVALRGLVSLALCVGDRRALFALEVGERYYVIETVDT